MREALAEWFTRGDGSVEWSEVERQEEALKRCDARVVPLTDESYPGRLRSIASPPSLLFVRGNMAIVHRPAVAIVGTRKPTAAGAAFAARLAKNLATLGVTVVSGLARGIDTAAHGGALAAPGATVAVVGTGVDVVYPPENRGLVERLAETGCIVSEQPCGMRPLAHHFPKRNRIISGLCDAVVVVQGGVRSGALITARWALEQGRDVGAVPGFPGDFRSAGPNQLLRDGAFVVEDMADVVANVRSLASLLVAPRLPFADGGVVTGLDAEAKTILDLIGRESTADEVATAAGLDAARTLELLVRFEIDGLVARDGMGRFSRLEAGGGGR